MDIAQRRRFEQASKDVARLDEQVQQLFAAYAELLTQVGEQSARIETLETKHANRSRRAPSSD